MHSRWIAGSDGRWAGKLYSDAHLAERIYSPYRDLYLGHLLLDIDFVDVAYSLGAERIVCRPPTYPGQVYTFLLATVKKYAERVKRFYAIDISFSEEARAQRKAS